MFMKRLYIITGAKGHLASTIIRYLKDTDCEIRGLILPSEQGIDHECISYFKGDISDIKSMQEIFTNLKGYKVVVIHAAGIISIERKVSPLLNKVNVLGTKNIITLCLEHHVHKLIYVSSVHAIPEKENLAAIEEVSLFSPDKVTGAYAKTKAQASQAVLDAVKQGLNAVIVHPSGIIGPYDTGNNHVVQLIKDYIAGKLPAGVSGGYDFVDVRDVAKGCIATVEKGEKGECYILSNRYCTIKELLEIMRFALSGPKKICIPLWLAKMVAPLFECFAKITKQRPLFTTYALYTLGSNGYFLHDKARKVLGYYPRNIQNTIVDTINWLQGKPLQDKPCCNENHYD